MRLATAFPCRYSPAFGRLRAQVQAGAIGEVLAIRGTNRGRMPGGWFMDRALSGGGAVIDHTVHVADLNRVLLGREATEVYAEIGSGFYHQEWDDTGFLTIGYDGGVFATLDTSWSRPKTYPTWGDVTMQVVGTGGVLDMDMFAQNLVHYDDAAGRVGWTNWGSGMDAGLVADFLRLARAKTRRTWRPARMACARWPSPWPPTAPPKPASRWPWRPHHEDRHQPLDHAARLEPGRVLPGRQAGRV